MKVHTLRYKVEKSDQVRRIRLPILLAAIALFATGCIVNTKAAERESLEALEMLLASHEDGEILREHGSSEPIQEVIEREYGAWFTEDYQNKINELIEAGQSPSMNIFLIRTTEYAVVANSQYGVLHTKVNRREGTVQYRLHPQKVQPPEKINYIDIEMTKEDGEWKIDDAEIVEAIYADFFF